MDRVYIGLEWDKLVELMQKGVICGTDIQPLNIEAKELVQQACLKSCVKKVCSGCDMSEVCGVIEPVSVMPLHQVEEALGRH